MATRASCPTKAPCCARIGRAPTLPADVVADFLVLNREAGLDAAGDENPDEEREPFDPESYYQAAWEETASFGIPGFGGVRQIEYAAGELPKYGAVGTFGIQGPGPEAVALDMLAVNGNYSFASGKIYNIESSRYIRIGNGLSGANGDITHPEAAHAVWQAAMAKA